jgi:hypothetical protein
MISSFTRQNESLIHQINQLMYYFRGSLGRDDAWALSYVEREIAISFINDRFKDAGEMMKAQIPVFV